MEPAKLLFQECTRLCEQSLLRAASRARSRQEIVLETRQLDASTIDQFLGTGF
jgi:hypothetical protein